MINQQNNYKICIKYVKRELSVCMIARTEHDVSILCTYVEQSDKMQIKTLI